MLFHESITVRPFVRLARGDEQKIQPGNRLPAGGTTPGGVDAETVATDAPDHRPLRRQKGIVPDRRTRSVETTPVPPPDRGRAGRALRPTPPPPRAPPPAPTIPHPPRNRSPGGGGAAPGNRHRPSGMKRAQPMRTEKRGWAWTCRSWAARICERGVIVPPR